MDVKAGLFLYILHLQQYFAPFGWVELPKRWSAKMNNQKSQNNYLHFVQFILAFLSVMHCIISQFVSKESVFVGAFWNISTRQMFCLSNCENQWQTAQSSLDNVNFSEHNVFLSFSAMCSLAGSLLCFLDCSPTPASESESVQPQLDPKSLRIQITAADIAIILRHIKFTFMTVLWEQ